MEENLKRYALRLIYTRMYTRAEIARKLCDKGADESMAERITAYLAESGYLNDEEYARRYVKTAIARGYGSHKINAVLREKGVDAHVIQKSIAAADTYQAIAPLIEKKCATLCINEPKDRNKLIAYLSRRGFELSQILAAIDEYKENTE